MNVSDRLRVHAGSVLTTTDRVLVEAADEIDRLRAELASWREAFGLLTTLHGSMPVDISDPLRMAKSIEVHVRAELAEAKKLKDGMLDVLGGACPNDHRSTPFEEFKGCTPCLRAELAVLRGRIADDAEHRAMGRA